ncbi:MAG: phosphomethylpyrimidine synthase ThiC [bacterium]
MTQLEKARKGIITDEMIAVAKEEGIEPEVVREKVASGRLVIPKNVLRGNTKVVGIGEGLRVKVNANIGTSPDLADISLEEQKLQSAVKAGADTVMDLSIGGDLKEIRKRILTHSPLPVGTVPIYQAAVETARRKGNITQMSVEDILKVVEEQAKEGVDFMTIHAGITLSTIEQLRKQGRVTGIVSRGGAFLLCWMWQNKKENPFYEYFDELLEILRKYDVTISIGDALRPGSIADASDRAQFQETIIQGELVQKCWEAGVQVMVEGPGHIPLHLVEPTIKITKHLTNYAPLYLLGPLVVDIAAGYDHIASAIGAAVAALAGADFICYVTPSEHLALPTPEEVYEGVIAARIAASAADLARGLPSAIKRNEEMSKARYRLDWATQLEYTIDKEKARKIRENHGLSLSGACTMCGEFCAMKTVEPFLNIIR